MLSMSPKTRVLTLKLDEDILAEFSAATTILRARSMAAQLHTFVVGQINKAREMVDAAEFQRLVQEHRQQTEERSKFRSEVRQRSLAYRDSQGNPHEIEFGEVVASLEPTGTKEAPVTDGVRVAAKGSKMPAAKTKSEEQPQKKQRRA